jgi:histidyl-tRNA synthetase
VFRNEKPGPGRFRQFMQFDADTVGAASPAADAEICMMAADCLEALGIARGDYVVKVNNRKVLDGVMEAIGLGGEANAGRRLTVLRAIDKFDRLGADGVRALLGKGRKDESGDFTKGAGLDNDAVEQLFALLGGKIELLPGESTPVMIGTSGPFGVERLEASLLSEDMEPAGPFEFVSNRQTLRLWERAFAETPTAVAGIQELREIARLCEAAGYGSRRIRIDPSVVRGLEYYTGPVFEAELTFEVRDEGGRQIRFGSVGGGGRYDGLVARFRSEPVPATGFSIGVSRLLAALRAIKSPIVAAGQAPGPVVVLALDRDEKSMASTQRLVASLRAAGMASELYLGQGGMNAQLKYADRRRSRVAVIQGSNERDAPGGPQVTIRDLKLGAELAKSTKDRSDYLELRQRAQFSASEADLVDRVREVLARK